MRILLKYQPVTGIGALGEALLRLSRGMGRLRAILQDRSAAEFIVVTRAAGLRALRPGGCWRACDGCASPSAGSSSMPSPPAPVPVAGGLQGSSTGKSVRSPEACDLVWP